MHPDRLWSVPDAAEWQTAAHDMTVHSKHTRLIHHQYPLSWQLHNAQVHICGLAAQAKEATLQATET